MGGRPKSSTVWVSYRPGERGTLALTLALALALALEQALRDRCFHMTTDTHDDSGDPGDHRNVLLIAICSDYYYIQV